MEQVTLARLDEILGTRPAPRSGSGPEYNGQITIEGEHVVVVTPERQRRALPLATLLELAAQPDRLGVLPTGLKYWWRYPGGRVAVHETPPRVWSFKWIDSRSRVRFGRGTRYRTVRLALPYLVVLAVFEGFGSPHATLASWNECFFAREPLDRAGLDTQLHYPALLNCSRFEGDERPLSWICVQYLTDKPMIDLTHPHGLDRGLRQGLAALLEHLLETGFNFSSEHHELNSFYSETVEARVDPRVADVDAWERATEADPCFALEVPWLPVGKSLREVLERIAKVRGNGVEGLGSAADVARLVCHYGKLLKETS